MKKNIFAYKIRQIEATTLVLKTLLTLFALINKIFRQINWKIVKVSQFFALKIQTFENLELFPVIPSKLVNKFIKQNLVNFHILSLFTAVNRRFKVQK